MSRKGEDEEVIVAELDSETRRPEAKYLIRKLHYSVNWVCDALRVLCVVLQRLNMNEVVLVSVPVSPNKAADRHNHLFWMVPRLTPVFHHSTTNLTFPRLCGSFRTFALDIRLSCHGNVCLQKVLL